MDKGSRVFVHGLSAALMLLFLLVGARLCSQEATGSIRGRVTDSSGAVAPNVQVTAIQLETGFTRQTKSDSRGNYSLVLLPVGQYRLEAEKDGFRKCIQDGSTLNVDQVAAISIRLALGSLQQTLEVRGDASLVQTTTNDLGETVRGREIVDLPLNGRNFTQLGLLLSAFGQHL